MLDGQGPVGASLPMRAAALIADGSTDRLGARERVEAALELERALMARRPGPTSAAELAGWVEEGVRRILREAALGELGADLSEAADETLIATGLDAGDAEIAVAAQDVEPAVARAASRPSPSTARIELAALINGPDRESDSSRAGSSRPIEEEHDMDQDTRILEPVPAEDEIRITATNWLDEVEVEESTLDFPAIEGDVAHRERIDTPRVRHLFPVPEDADWEVRELEVRPLRRRTPARRGPAAIAPRAPRCVAKR